MMRYLVLILAAVQVTAHYHGGLPPPPPPPLSPVEQRAFQEVENVCQLDVEKFCRPPEELFADPVMNWLFAPERLAPPPLLHPRALEPTEPLNLGPLVEHMLDSALRIPMIMQQEPVFTMIFIGAPEDEESSSDERALDSMVSRLVQHSNCDKMNQEAAEEPTEAHDVIHHIRLKGQEVLEQEGVPEDRRRLARRLTEVSPEEMMKQFHPHPTHPHQKMFPHEFQCLRQAKQENKLLPDCAEALVRMERVHEAEMHKMHDQELYLSLFWLYCILFFSLFTMILVRKIKAGRGLFRLRLLILRAVYSNPEIKAKIEDEVGVPLGAVPPLATHGLMMLSADGRAHLRRKHKRFVALLYFTFGLFVLDAFGVMPPCWPLWVMALCCAFMGYRMINLCCSKPEVRDCKCCCCGATATDAESGMLTDSQACCKCCKGTGVCSVKCHTCCGTADKDGGGCCGGSCSCSKDHNCDGSCGCCGDSDGACALRQKLLVAVVEDCKCCCCGASVTDVENGTLTDSQACCKCCKGTGTCSVKCHTCCGTSDKDGGGCCGGSCSCSKDHNCDGSCGCCGDSDMPSRKVILGPNLVIYQGVPVQIV